MPLGGLIPYEGEDMELPVSLDEGDLNDGQYMGPEGDRNLPAEGDSLIQRMLRRKPKLAGLPQTQPHPGPMPMPGMDENQMAVAQALMGRRG